jgi:uncharacterized SAM-dependent methyltransferase
MVKLRKAIYNNEEARLHIFLKAANELKMIVASLKIIYNEEAYRYTGYFFSF